MKISSGLVYMLSIQCSMVTCLLSRFSILPHTALPFDVLPRHYDFSIT
uniref:Uncharacterized protein n=1 Tax=Rhizophora mucronata TaxID=61149 RepID=A0A2P2PTB9_RHIMU